MNDAVLMRGFKSGGDFDGDAQKLQHLHWPTSDGVFQRLAFEKFHGQEDAAIFVANVVDGTDVRMIQRGGCASFAPKALKSLRILG